MNSLLEKWVVQLLKKQYLPVWAIFILDGLIAGLSYFFSQFLLTNFDWEKINSYNSIQEILLLLGFYLFFFVFFRTHIGAFRHTGVKDLMRLSYAAVCASTSAYITSKVAWQLNWFDTRTFTAALTILQGVSFMLGVVGIRLFVKLAYSRYVLKSTQRKDRGVLIYGAGNTGITVRNAIKQDSSTHRDVVGFVDDNLQLQGKSIDGIRVFSFEQAFEDSFLSKNKVKEVVWSAQYTQTPQFYKVGDLCIKEGLEFQKVPNIKDWIGGNLSRKQLKRVRIEDLLNRSEIHLENSDLRSFLAGKRILVTGGAGSIGSELCRQILFYQPAKLIVFDNAETPLNDLWLELQTNPHYQNNAICLVGDVTRENRVQQVFADYKPEIVFHAAAYKHVPMMELNAKEAVRVNVHGTRLVADAAIANGCEKFVFISTDKAVNPTNVMGASKRAAEIYIQGLQGSQSSTQFVTTRFGNVLGSNGSVIPLFRKQIENRESLTVTHKDVVRYFMTIPEACQLVFEAGRMSLGGEIYVFDMGEPVRIYDLAEKMIKLSGLVLGRDIQIIETGLRPGEKLYEELLADSENTKATHHPKILIAQVRNNISNKQYFEKLSYASLNGLEDIEIVRTLKTLVPEFKSQNSSFELLD